MFTDYGNYTPRVEHFTIISKITIKKILFPNKRIPLRFNIQRYKYKIESITSDNKDIK